MELLLPSYCDEKFEKAGITFSKDSLGTEDDLEEPVLIHIDVINQGFMFIKIMLARRMKQMNKMCNTSALL